MDITKSQIKGLVYRVIGAAIEVHKLLGPGLLESVYHRCMEKELKLKNIRFKSELLVPLNYKGLEIDTRLRCDMLIEDILTVELKSVKEILPIHETQILTYMKLLQVPKGILINFNTNHIYREGQHTYVNELYRRLKD